MPKATVPLDHVTQLSIWRISCSNIKSSFSNLNLKRHSLFSVFTKPNLTSKMKNLVPELFASYNHSNLPLFISPSLWSIKKCRSALAMALIKSHLVYRLFCYCELRTYTNSRFYKRNWRLRSLYCYCCRIFNPIQDEGKAKKPPTRFPLVISSPCPLSSMSSSLKAHPD